MDLIFPFGLIALGALVIYAHACSERKWRGK